MDFASLSFNWNGDVWVLYYRRKTRLYASIKYWIVGIVPAYNIIRTQYVGRDGRETRLAVIWSRKVKHRSRAGNSDASPASSPRARTRFDYSFTTLVHCNSHRTTQKGYVYYIQLPSRLRLTYVRALLYVLCFNVRAHLWGCLPESSSKLITV